MTWTRRHWLAALAAGQGVSASRVAGNGVVELEWSHLPSAAARLAEELGLNEENWSAWREERARVLARRIQAGSAEHVTYYLLLSRAFTEAAPILPVKLAREKLPAMPAAALRRAREFQASFEAPLGPRHAAVVRLARSIEREWPVERSFRHTMDFLREKEVERSVPLDRLYFRRGLSADTSVASLAVLESILGAEPRRILLAGPGLDLTRRDRIDDALPLKSYQQEHLRRRYPQAVVDTLDVRPEVIEAVGARRVDLTTAYLNGDYDLVIATNVLLYFEDRELLTAMAGFARALRPGGRLLHNDTRFAAKVFGDALELPVEKFAPRQLASNKGIEQWDRAVIHRKVSARAK